MVSFLVPASSQIIGAIEFGQYWVRVPTVPPIVQGRQLHPMIPTLGKLLNFRSGFQTDLSPSWNGLILKQKPGLLHARHSKWKAAIGPYMNVWAWPGMSKFLPGTSCSSLWLSVDLALWPAVLVPALDVLSCGHRSNQ